MIISVLTLVLTLAALGTTTFAWFSLSTTSKVSNIEGTVTGGEGLEIQLFAQVDSQTHKTGWMANLNADAVGNFLEYFNGEVAGGVRPYTRRFDAVTTSDGHVFTKMIQDETTGALLLNDTATANVDYLEFEIWFRSQSEGDVSLTNLTFGGATKDFKPDGADYLQAPGITNTFEVVTRAAYGARIAFINTSNQVKAYQMDNAGNVLRNEGNQVLGNALTGANPVEVGQYSYLTTGRNLELKLNAAGDPIEPSDFSSINLLAAAVSTSLDTEVALVVGALGAGESADWYTGKLTVRIWIEGWDPDSYDSIYETLLTIDLTFKKDVNITP